MFFSAVAIILSYFLLVLSLLNTYFDFKTNLSVEKECLGHLQNLCLPYTV